MALKNCPKVNIILAVYNGQKYLCGQLDSLLAQTYENIDIYVRDDGSTDNTVGIVKKYIEDHAGERRIVLLENDGKNLKCPGSFYEIIRKCDPAKYYSLCDQDDCWYPQKVEWAVECLEREEQDQILVYYSACDYQTADGVFIRKSPLQKPQVGLVDTLYYTPGSGFTIMFNEKARQELILKCDPGQELHDRWLLRGAACFGKAVYDERSTAAHIRHEEAVTAGDSENKNLIMHFFRNELCGEDAKREKMNLAYFYKVFDRQLNEQQRRLLVLFSQEKNTIGNWLRKIFFSRRLRRRLPGEIALRILFFLGRI